MGDEAARPLLDLADPALGIRYREAFLRALARPDGRGGFDTGFPIPDRLMGRLQAELRRAP